MSVVSIRFSDQSVSERLKAKAKRGGVSISSLAERLIDEGLRRADHPDVDFRDGPAGRRPVMLAGPELTDVLGYMIGSEIPVDERRTRAAEHLCVPVSVIDAALAYYADFTAEVDADLADRAAVADEEERAWRRQRELLAR